MRCATSPPAFQRVKGSARAAFWAAAPAVLHVFLARVREGKERAEEVACASSRASASGPRLPRCREDAIRVFYAARLERVRAQQKRCQR